MPENRIPITEVPIGGRFRFEDDRAPYIRVTDKHEMVYKDIKDRAVICVNLKSGGLFGFRKDFLVILDNSHKEAEV
jgi:hypothetical protein